MKPTEEQIREKLIEGWEIGDKSRLHDIEKGGWFRIQCGENKLLIGFFKNSGNIEFHRCSNSINERLSDFLSGNYDLSSISQHYSPEEWQRIIDMCKDIVRIITGEQDTIQTEPEQTLEEKVREEVSWFNAIGLEISNEHVRFKTQIQEYLVKPESIATKTLAVGAPWHSFDLDGYLKATGEKQLTRSLLNIAAELKKRSTTKPTYEELEQRVAELEEGKQLLIKDCEIWKRKHDELETKTEFLKSANSQWSSQFKEVSDRINDLESQLQECISKSDHEAEVQKCNELLAFESSRLEEALNDADKYHQWFEEAHAERLKLKEAGR